MLPAHRLSWRWWDLFKLWLEGDGKNTTEKHRERDLCVFISLDLDLFFNPHAVKNKQKTRIVPRKSYCVSLEKVKQAFSVIKWLAESSVFSHNLIALLSSQQNHTRIFLQRLLCVVQGFYLHASSALAL